MPVVGLGGRSFPGVFSFSGGLEGRGNAHSLTSCMWAGVFSKSSISFHAFLATYLLVTDLCFFLIVFGTLLLTHLEQVTPDIHVRVPFEF